MKPTTYLPLYNYFFKYIGLLLSISGLALVLLDYSKFEILIYFGLLIIAFAKEKTENQNTVNARNEVFKSIFGFYLSLMIALNLVQIFSPDFIFQPGPFIYVGIPIILYLLLFYVSLLLNVNLDSSVELSENIRGHRKFYFTWVLLVILVFLVILIVKLNN